ncbi:MAG: hypothetical protein EOM10_16105, partial [Opitutae bacterium]|nr:hypothetical protein [Opitutae bacterium]
MKNNTLYLHIGAPKTGSTALQRGLADSRESLLESGILYPEAASRAGGHHDLAFLLHGRYPEWAIPQDAPLETLWAELEAEVGAHSGDVILSSENFYLYPAPEALARLMEASEPFRRFRVRVVVYVRPQEAAVESWYNQAVKAQGVSAEFPDF